MLLSRKGMEEVLNTFFEIEINNWEVCCGLETLPWTFYGGKVSTGT